MTQPATTRHLILISGKDSLAAALLQVARRPDFSYEFVFNDVSAELPETYAWIDKVERATGWPIKRVGKSLVARIRGRHGFLPSRRARYCTPECKIEPTEDFIGNDKCFVYYGLRADEARTGYVPVGKPNVTPVYPLRDLNVDLQGVYSILDAQGLMPPDFFWPRMYAAVKGRLSGDWEGSLSRLERQLLFAGRTRANCFFCFFQRRYELVWLLEAHPDLYAVAESMEKDDYSFIKDLPLRELRHPERAETIFQNRVDDVVEIIAAKQQGRLFGEPADNEMALVSCGLLCGK